MQITGAVLEVIGAERPYARSRPVAITDLELGPPGNQEVLVRISAAGLCHSDLSVVNGSRIRPVPMLLGHEAAGHVVACGPDVASVAPGDHVVMTFLPRCGTCPGCATEGVLPCQPGSAANAAGSLMNGDRRLSRNGQPVHHHLGVSAFATHAIVDQRSLVKVDPDIPFDVAALLGCAVLTGGGSLVNAGRPQSGASVAVVGLGGVGMAAVLTALALGEHQVLAVDPQPDKLVAAGEFGAHTALTPAEAIAAGQKADIVIEAAGTSRAFETAVALTAPGGKTITVGLPHPEDRASISPLGLVAEGRSIIGSYLGSAVPERDIPMFADMWRAGRLPLERLISSHIELEDINAGLDALADGLALRQIVSIEER